MKKYYTHALKNIYFGKGINCPTSNLLYAKDEFYCRKRNKESDKEGVQIVKVSSESTEIKRVGEQERGRGGTVICK